MPDPALKDLLALLAFGQLQAFDRMAADARHAPDLRRRAALAEMATAELVGYRRLVGRLGELSGDGGAGVAEAYAAMAPFAEVLEAYHDQTEPKDWLEALTKAYVGDGIADDFYGEIAAFLDEGDRALVLEVLHDDRYTSFAAAEIRDAIAADPKVANRLSMWGRRLVGEAMSQAMRVAEDRPALVALIAARADDETDVAGLFRRITAAHTARMAAVGLNN